MPFRDDDELYSGYDENNPLATSTAGLFQGDAGPAPGTAFAKPMTAKPMTAKPMTAAPGTAMRGTTAMVGGPGEAPGTARPMTSNRGAGFQSDERKKFDPLNQARSSVGASLGGINMKKPEVTAEESARDMEKKVHELLEESAALCAANDFLTALDKGSDAKKRERALTRFREQNNLSDSINQDLTYAVDLNLAQAYHVNKLYQEALNAYTAIVKNKAYPQAGRLRVNMGNIFYEQKKFSSSIKMYRMALDQIPATAKEVRFRIMRNIGLSFVRMGQYQDALQAFATCMDNVPDHVTGYNLVVCSFALGDRDAMKRSFQRLIEVPPPEEDDDEPPPEDDDINNVMHEDGLKDELKKRQAQIRKYVLNASRLIAERIDRNGFVAGYDWCAGQLRTVGQDKLANEVELAKASRFLSRKEFQSAINVFKDFERKEHTLKARAATNLSFLYMLEGEVESAAKYTDLAIKTDKYNARAYVNRGNVMLERGDLEGARANYQEALSIEPYCVEAIYNSGLVHMRTSQWDYAVSAFKKLHSMLPDNVEVIHQIANCYDAMGDYRAAVKWLEMLSSLLPNDPGVLAKLGAIHARLDDEGKALHYYQESHRVFPVNMDVISWLGAFHVKNEVYEKAVPYFDLASKIQPQEVKWSLMVASCLRRIGDIPKALAKYKEIHSAHPDNIECLRYLVHLCTDLGRRDDANDYLNKLRRAERAQMAEATAQASAATMGPRQAAPEDPEFGAPRQAPMSEEQTEEFRLEQKNQRKVQVGSKVADDWANEELGDDLLPM